MSFWTPVTESLPEVKDDGTARLVSAYVLVRDADKQVDVAKVIDYDCGEPHNWMSRSGWTIQPVEWAYVPE